MFIHERLTQNLMMLLASKNLYLNSKVNHMMQRTTREKLLSYLSAESVSLGSPSFDIPFNRQQLADYLSVDRSAMIYLMFSEENEPLRYLTVELSPEGGYELFGWDSSLAYKGYGAYEGRNERDVIDSVVKEVLGGATGDDVGGRYGEMCEILDKNGIEYYSEEVSDYIRMFDVIGELTENALELPAMVLSVASYGCNLRCPFCQNWEISMAAAGDVQTRYLTPEQLCSLAAELGPQGNIGIAYTYNEPLTGYEFVRDTAELIRGAGMKNVLVSNGSVSSMTWPLYLIVANFISGHSPFADL